MTFASNRPLELVPPKIEQDLGELATVAETLSVLEQWVRDMPNPADFNELSKQLRLAQIEARRLIDDEGEEPY